jgi:hypothetical protein
VSVRIAGLALALVFLSGCATQPQLPVPLGASAIGAQGGRVGVAMTPLPKVDTQFPGADCLLCLAVASMANNALTAHTKSLPAEDLPMLKELVAEQLRKRDANVRVIAEEVKIDDLPNASAQGPNIARKDFASLQKKYEIDKLLVISIASLGFERTYAAYVPTSDPKALVRGVAFMVDLKTNTYDWYHPLNVLRSADGAWDEPAKFPGLTNAYFQAIEIGKDEVLKPFKP